MKTDKKRSFKGAVLFTVVSVMSLLIVFLTGTLVLATAANNRAHKSYSSSQANYTARAAIDSILQAAADDPSFATAMGNLTSGNGFDVDITMENSVNGIGRVDKARVQYAGKKQFYDSDSQEWVERDLLSITADVTSGGETKTVTAYALKNPPQVTSSGSGGGGFVTVGTAATPVGTSSYGGTYLGIGMHKGQRYYMVEDPTYFPTGQLVTLDDKLYLNLKDTDQPGYLDPSGNYLPNNPENADILAKFSFPNPTIVEAPAVINGSLDISTQTEVFFPTKASGMSVWGNMTFTNNRFKVYSETVNNNVSNNYNQEIAKFSDIPYIYVDSLMKFVVGFQLGDSNLPLNVFCGSMDARSNGSMQFYADVYCQDKGKTSYLGNSSANTKLHAWSTSVVNGTESYLNTVTTGNFYTKGNLVIDGNGAEIAGDLVVEGDLTVNGKLTVGGSVVVGGTLTANNDINVGGGHSICADNATGTKITADLSKKMTADGTQELYEEKQRSLGYCVLAKNVRIRKGPNPWDVETSGYAWLKPDAIAALGLTDSDGDGIIDGNVVDLHFWTEVDESFVEERLWGGLGWGQDEHTITKEYLETYWENREDPTDITTNELDTYDSNGFKYNGTPIAGTDFYKNTHSGEMFPRKAEKEVILGFKDVNGGTDATLIKDSKVLKTVEEIEQEYSFDTKSITEIPADNGYLADVTNNVYTAGNMPAEITTSCTLQGDFRRDIVIKNTSTNDIWVKLDGFSMDNIHDIIYDDSSAGCGNLNIFVENSASFSSGCSVYTKTYKDYFDNNTAFQIVTNNSLYDASHGVKAECPKINIYSAPASYAADGSVISQPTFSLNNTSIVTAAIEAPNMKFELSNAKSISNTIYYDATEVRPAQGSQKEIGVIGILNVAGGTMSNDWIFLYTPREAYPYCTCTGCSCGGSSNCSTCGLPCVGHCTCSGGGTGGNSYVVMYYEGF